MLDFIHELFVQITQSFDVAVRFGIGRDRDQAVVTFRFPVFGLFGFDHAQQSGRNKATREGRFVHQEEQIERVAIIAKGSRDKAEIIGEYRPGG